MALIVEDGTGLDDAESYVSVAEIKSYWSVRGDPSAISGATDAVLEEKAREATAYLDGIYSGRYAGYKKTKEQSLQWPRYDAYESGWLISGDIIPQRLKSACCELIFRAMSANLSIDLTSGEAALKREYVRAGSVVTSQEFVGASNRQPVYTTAKNLIKPILQGGGAVPLIRA